MPIEPADIILAVIRSVIAIGIVVVLYSLIVSFSQVVQTGDVERTAFDLSEGFVSSNFTTERGIIDVDRLPNWAIELDNPIPDEFIIRSLRLNPRPEPIRNCRFGATFLVRDSNLEGVSASGILWKPKDGKSNSVRSPVWLLKEGALEPGELEVQVHLSALTRMTCAVEEAWVHGESQIEAPCPRTAELLIASFGTCEMFTDGEKICVDEECRVMGISVDSFEWEHGDTVTFRRIGDRVTVVVD